MARCLSAKSYAMCNRADQERGESVSGNSIGCDPKTCKDFGQSFALSDLAVSPKRRGN